MDYYWLHTEGSETASYMLATEMLKLAAGFFEFDFQAVKLDTLISCYKCFMFVVAESVVYGVITPETIL